MKTLYNNFQIFVQYKEAPDYLHFKRPQRPEQLQVIAGRLLPARYLTLVANLVALMLIVFEQAKRQQSQNKSENQWQSHAQSSLH